MTTTISYPCPTCKKISPWHENPTRPFCSERCRLIDLGEWASENYKIQSQDEPFSDELHGLDNAR